MSTKEDETKENDGTALARRIRSEREAKEWSLAALAERAGVSKAMLSKIERGEASPTAAILSRIAAAYGLTMAALFEPVGAANPRLLRARDQPLWRDPKTLYLRRQVFLGPSNPLELVEIEFPPDRKSAFRPAHTVWSSRSSGSCPIASPLWRAPTGTNLPRAIASNLARRRTSCSATKGRGPAAIWRLWCADDRDQAPPHTNL